MASGTAVVDWLLDAGPAIRWQVLRDVTDAPADTVAEERARVATEGWGAQLLAVQTPDGGWGGTDPGDRWRFDLSTLHLLRELAPDPEAGPCALPGSPTTTSTWSPATAARAAGSPCARCACSAGPRRTSAGRLLRAAQD
ncbi:hypothetical protein ACEXQE_15395 [Herbiconiux sp. P17]|uniref:hypothetical protein n=1 Tax=Herbiconiux wuyangfengii TaxID=3342794 RepID=UPI0035B9A041